MTRQASQDIGTFSANRVLWDGADMSGVASVAPQGEMLAESLACSLKTEPMTKEQQEAEDFANLLTMPFT
jgi:hypothetical protein